VFVFGEGLSLCQLGLCAEDGFLCVLNEKRELRFLPARDRKNSCSSYTP
jgi:hypothetical protein